MPVAAKCVRTNSRILHQMEFILHIIQFILKNIIVSLIPAFFTVIGGVIPIAILVFIFSIKEKERLLSHAKEIENTLPILEQLLKSMAELVKKTINNGEVTKGAEQFKQLVESQNIVNENKKFIKYAENYNFISAVGHILRASNYMPKSIDEHKEISKNLPNSSSSDT